MVDRCVLRAALLAAVVGLCAHASPLLTLIPSSGFAGAAPGLTTGWGFTITNDTPYYLLVDSSNFCESGGDPFFADCSNGATPFGPALGSYNDFIANNATLIAPEISPGVSSVTTQAFNLALQQGVGSYTFDPSTPLLAKDVGTIFVSFVEFNGNPFVTNDPVSGDIEISASATAEAAPEPASWAMAGSALLLAGAFVRRRRWTKAPPPQPALPDFPEVP